MQWFAVMTNPRCEETAARNLKRGGYYTFFPHERRRRRRKRANANSFIIEWVTRPYFNRYIFVALREGQGLYGVNEADGVSTVVYSGPDPLQIPIPVMDELMARGDKNGQVGAFDDVSRKLFKPDQLVAFKDNSPLCGLLGQIAVDNGKEVSVWLTMLGVRRKVSVDPSVVAEIAQ